MNIWAYKFRTPNYVHFSQSFIPPSLLWVFVIFCLLKCNWICLKIVQTDRQTDRRRTNGRTDRRTDRRKDDGRTDRQTDGGTDRQTDGQTSVTQSGDINKPLSQRWCKTKVLRASFFFCFACMDRFADCKVWGNQSGIAEWATQRHNLGRIIITILIASNGLWLRTLLLIRTSYHSWNVRKVAGH